MEATLLMLFHRFLLRTKALQKVHFHLSEMKFTASSFQNSFNHVGRTANCVVDFLANGDG